MTRGEWLARRISGDFHVADSELRGFYNRWMSYRTEQLFWNAWEDLPREDPSDWERCSKAYSDLIEDLETLSSRIGLPVGQLQRLRARRRLHRERRRRSRRP
jgi:hypothetical protein